MTIAFVLLAAFCVLTMGLGVWLAFAGCIAIAFAGDGPFRGLPSIRFGVVMLWLALVLMIVGGCGAARLIA